MFHDVHVYDVHVVVGGSARSQAPSLRVQDVASLVLMHLNAFSSTNHATAYAGLCKDHLFISCSGFVEKEEGEGFP